MFYFGIDIIWLLISPSTALGIAWEKSAFINHLFPFLYAYLVFFQWQEWTPFGLYCIIYINHHKESIKFNYRHIKQITGFVPVSFMHCEWNAMLRDIKKLLINKKVQNYIK